MSAVEWRALGRKAVALLDSGTAEHFAHFEQALVDEWDGSASAVTILLPWREPPACDSRDDGAVYSFVCSSRLLAELPSVESERLCYLLLKAILDGKLRVDRLLVRQLPYERPGLERSGNGTAALLMAHRGNAEHLRVALSYLPASEIRIRVGLDTEDDAAYRSLAQAYPEAEFFQGSPSPAGPYVIRQALAERSTESWLVFHDSDDASCSDRIPALQTEVAAEDCDMIGCHELQVDEVTEQIRAVRYPLDVAGALRAGPYYCLLHGTSMIRREAFFAAGGFSTDRMISIDTQFLYRAYFQLRMRNADRFLYIRRRHAAALTVNAGTAIGSGFRREIERPWGPDFEAVKSGQLELSKSTLVAVRTATDHRLTPLFR